MLKDEIAWDGNKRQHWEVKGDSGGKTKIARNEAINRHKKNVARDGKKQ